jgi:hypothetical protein
MTALEETTLQNELEALIDGSSLTDVITALAVVCREKAEHLRENWQDRSTAKTWEQDATLLDKTVLKIMN